MGSATEPVVGVNEGGSLASLRAQLRTLAVRPATVANAEARAHVADSLARIDQALNSVVQRSGF
jgi:hypothetical protein